MVAGDGLTDGNASFLRAARAGNLDKVLEYLKGSIDINTSNAQNGLNALHLASKEGHVHVVTELLKRGANGNAATKKGNTALHIASLAGQEEVVKILVQNGANVNVQSQNGFTPLYMAAQENHDGVVRFLLSNGANQSLATEDGFTPLAVALQQGHDKVVAVLLENDTKGRVRLPALHIAAKKDDCKAAALLLQNDHNPDVTSKSGFTPLHIAAHYGNENIANLLLDKGADVNYTAKHQITPLHVASKWGKANMVTLLLDRGAKIEASTRDGLTPLHCAARSGHDQVVDLLLEKGAPIVAKTKNGLAPLHMASQGDHVDSARILLYHKAPVDDVTVDYLTALHVAAHCGHVRVAKLLLDRKADPNARALNGFTPLHIACKKNRIKVVELLLKHGASIEATTESGLTPLHVASFMGCMNIVIFLIQHGASPDVPTVRGETPLHLAARANQTDIIRILLRNGAHVDARAREDQTPLHIASRLGNVDIVSLLLQHGAAVDATTKDLYTPLHIAAKEGQEEVASVLLDHGASLTSTTKKGFTPLHLAAKYGNIKVARLLLQKDAPVDAQGKNGVTPLHVAAHYDHVNVALLLLEKGASPHAMSKNGYTPLHIAAKKNQMDIATTLLEYGAKANAQSKAGFTPLHLGSQEGHTDVTTLLIEHGADANAKAKNGLTPLHLCAQEDRVNVAAVLVKCGAEVGLQTKAGYTPLHVASHFGQINMVRFLLQQGADVNITTSHGYTPLHQAAQQGHTLIINLLLDNKASPNVTTTQGQTALSIAQRLGYISVVETLKVVTETIVTTTTTTVTEEKYKVVAPETMQETFMTDSEDEGGDDTMLGEQSYRYLTADEMKFLGDDSLPIDVTKDERHPDTVSINKDLAAPLMVEEEQLSPQHVSQLESSFSEKYSPDNVDISHVPVHAGLKWKTFLVSFMVDARGGAMRGCRHSGVRVIIPPRKAPMPMRITCRYLRKEKLIHPPPLMEGEACASRILEVGPVNARFLGPVIIEVPHFASLRGKEREITILRSDNGESWREHTLEASEEAVQEVLNESFEGEEFTALEDLNTNRITRILTTDFPQYFALITRVRQEVHAVGPEGGMVSSTVVPQVQAIFPEGALTKKIKVGLQAQPISPELVAKLLGNRVAVSPIVTVEPRRRKFHKPITLTIPVPQAATKGMINQYSGDAPTLRLLCSITGGTTKAQWEDVTGSTPLTFVNECVSFTTTVSARFWLMDCRQVNEATKFATELYQEAIHVPFMAKFVVFAKRYEPMEAQLRVFCMTDDKEDKTLECQEHFTEIAKSRDIEVLEGKLQYLEFAGNLVPVTKSGEQLKLTFQAFRENRLPFIIRVKDLHQEPMGRIAFMREPRVGRGEPPQTPICNLNVALPDVCPIISSSTAPLSECVTLERKYGFVQESGLAKPELIHRADLRLSDIARELDKDWVALALQLDISESDIISIKAECPEETKEQALIMLRLWMQRAGPRATGNELEKALRKISREDIVSCCMFNVELVTDDVEKAVAKVHLDQSGFDVFKEELGSSRETSIRRGPSLDVSYDEQDIMKEAESAAETSSETGSVFEKEQQQVIAQEREGKVTKPTKTPPPSPEDSDFKEKLLEGRDVEEKPIQKEVVTTTVETKEVDDGITKRIVTTVAKTAVVQDAEEILLDIREQAKLTESETWLSGEMDTSQVSVSSLPDDEKSEPTTATVSSATAEPEAPLVERDVTEVCTEEKEWSATGEEGATHHVIHRTTHVALTVKQKSDDTPEGGEEALQKVSDDDSGKLTKEDKTSSSVFSKEDKTLGSLQLEGTAKILTSEAVKGVQIVKSISEESKVTPESGTLVEPELTLHPPGDVGETDITTEIESLAGPVVSTQFSEHVTEQEAEHQAKGSKSDVPISTSEVTVQDAIHGGAPGFPLTLASEHAEYDEKISNISSASSDLAMRDDSDKDIISQEHVKPEQQRAASEATDTEEQFSPSPPKDIPSVQTSVHTVSPLPRPSPPEPSSFVVDSEISPATDYPSQLTAAMQVHVGLSPTELQRHHFSPDLCKTDKMEMALSDDTKGSAELSHDGCEITEAKQCHTDTTITSTSIISTATESSTITVSSILPTATSQGLEKDAPLVLPVSGMAFDNTAFVGAEVIDAADADAHARAISPYEVVRDDKEIFKDIKQEDIMKSSEEYMSKQYVYQEKILRKIDELEGDKEVGIPKDEDIFYFEPETIPASDIEGLSKSSSPFTHETFQMEDKFKNMPGLDEIIPHPSSESSSHGKKVQICYGDEEHMTEDDSFLIRKEEATKIAKEIIKEIKTEVAKRPPLQHTQSEISEEDLVEKGENSPREQEIQHGIEREELEVRRQSCFDIEEVLLSQEYKSYTQKEDEIYEGSDMTEDISQQEDNSSEKFQHHLKSYTKEEHEEEELEDALESKSQILDESEITKSTDLEVEGCKLIVTEHGDFLQKDEGLKSRNGESSSGETETLYQSFETSESGKTPQGTPETSRPCSSELEVNISMHPSSEYETCVTSHEGSGEASFATAATSRDGSYTSVRSPISQSSKESAFSIDSESSGHLASIESGMSETLMPSAQEIEMDISREAETPTVEEETDGPHFTFKEPYDTVIPPALIKGKNGNSTLVLSKTECSEVKKIDKSNLSEVQLSKVHKDSDTSESPLEVWCKSEVPKSSIDSEGTVEAISDSSEVEKSVKEESFLIPSVSSDGYSKSDKLQTKSMEKYDECKDESVAEATHFEHDAKVFTSDFISAEVDQSWNLPDTNSSVPISHHEEMCTPSSGTYERNSTLIDNYHPTPQPIETESIYSQINGPVEVDFIPEYDMPYDDMSPLSSQQSLHECQESQRITGRTERTDPGVCDAPLPATGVVEFELSEATETSHYLKDDTKFSSAEIKKAEILEEQIDLESLPGDCLIGPEITRLESSNIESDIGAVGGLDQKPFIYIKEDTIKEFHTSLVTPQMISKEASEVLEMDLDIDEGVQYYRSVSEDTVDAEIGKILSLESQMEDDIIERPQTPEPPEDVQLHEEPDFLPESEQDMYKDKSESTSSLNLSKEGKGSHCVKSEETLECKTSGTVPFTSSSTTSCTIQKSSPHGLSSGGDENIKSKDFIERAEQEEIVDTSPEDNRYEMVTQKEILRESFKVEIQSPSVLPDCLKEQLEDTEAVAKGLKISKEHKEFHVKYDSEIPDTYAYNMQFEREFDSQQEEEMDLGSDQYTDDKEEIEDCKQATYNYGMRFERDNDFEDDDLPGYGDLYTHHEEEEETFEEGEREKHYGQTAAPLDGQKHSLPDYDTLAGRKFFSKSGEHDDVSVSSLQEFERLEEEIAMGRKSSVGSVDSLNGRQFHSKSGDHDDVSMNSLTEFERLERECAEAERVEAIVKEEAAKLSEIDEGHESQASEASQETISDNGHESNDSDDYEKRLSEIDEIIRQAQTNVENFQVQQPDIPHSIPHAFKHQEGTVSSGDSTTSSRLDRTPSPKKDPDTDSLDETKIHIKPETYEKVETSFPTHGTGSSITHKQTDSQFKEEIQFASKYHSVQKDIDQDSLHEELDISVEHDSLHGDDKHQFHDSLHEDKSGDLDSLQDDIKGEMQDSLHEVKGLDEDSLHEMDLLPDEPSLSIDGSSAAAPDASQSSSQAGCGQKYDIAQGCILQDLDVDLLKGESAVSPAELNATGIETAEIGKGDCMISSTDSLEPSSSTATHATYQFETDSVMSSSLNSVQTSEDYTMVSSTDTLDPESRITYIYGDASLGDFQVLTRDQEKAFIDSEGNIQTNQHIKFYTDSEGNIQKTILQPVKDIDEMGNKIMLTRPLTSETLSVTTGTVCKKGPANIIYQTSPDHREKGLETRVNISSSGDGIETVFKTFPYIETSKEADERPSGTFSYPDNVKIEEIQTYDEKGNPKIIRQTKRTIHSQSFASPPSSDNMEERLKEFLKKSVPSSSGEENIKEERTVDEKGNVVILRTVERLMTTEPEVHSKTFTGPDAEKKSKQFINEFEKYKLREDVDQFETTDEDGNIIHVTQKVTVQPKVHTVSFSGPDAHKQMEEYMKQWSEESTEQQNHYDLVKHSQTLSPQHSTQAVPTTFAPVSTTRYTSSPCQLPSTSPQRNTFLSSSTPAVGFGSVQLEPECGSEDTTQIIRSGHEGALRSHIQFQDGESLSTEESLSTGTDSIISTTVTTARTISTINTTASENQEHAIPGDDTVSEEVRDSLRESMQQVLDDFMSNEEKQDLVHKKE